MKEESVSKRATRGRANFVPAPHYFELNAACQLITQAFGTCPYLVGSSLESKSFRDVDVRLILDDDEYAKLFPGLSGNPSLNARWSLLCASISLWLSKRTGLPIDFQIQQQTEMLTKYKGVERQPIGMFFEPNSAATTGATAAPAKGSDHDGR